MSWSPARRTASPSHITVESTLSSDGPHCVSCQVSPENLSAPVVANRAHRFSWSSARTLTQNLPESRISGQERDVCAGQNSTSGGAGDDHAAERGGQGGPPPPRLPP